MNINNINNDGLVAFDGIRFYYSNITSDDGKLYKKSIDFKNTEKLSDISNVNYINIKDNYIYYVSENKIYKLNITTIENEVIYIHNNEYEWISNMGIINKDMFFSTNDEESTQYIMDLDILHANKLYCDAYGFIINNNKIYYSGNKDFGIYSFNLNTNRSLKLVDDNTLFPIISDNFLYFFNLDEKNFYKLNINNHSTKESIVKLNGAAHEDINYYNIIYNNLIFSKESLFKYNFVTKETTIIQNMNSSEINIINNEIWFKVYENDEFKLYKTDLNGENLTLID